MLQKFARTSKKVHLVTKCVQKRSFVDRSFRLANVVDLAVAQQYKDRLQPSIDKYWVQQSERRPRDINKQLVIDLSHEQGYRRGHIPNAVNLPMEAFDYTRNVDAYGGIHQEEVVSLMKNLGINDDTSEIILYDNSGLLSCRLWFVLRYFGFRNVRILNAGWRAYLKSGLPIQEETVKPKVAGKFNNLKPKRTYLVTKPTQMVFDFQHKTSKYIDTRVPDAYEKYHIEGAIHFPAKIIMEDAKFATVSEIRENVAKNKLSLDDRMIIYSSNSLTSCVVLFGLNMVGADHCSVYDAGVDDWKRNYEERLNVDQESFLKH